MAASPLQVPPNCDLTLGLRCVDKSTPGRSVWAMTADERFSNPAGIIQGGFLAAFADSTMGAAAVSAAKDRKVFCANAELKISFLEAVTPGTPLECVAEVLRSGKRVAFIEATISDDAGRVIARISSTYLYAERT